MSAKGSLWGRDLKVRRRASLSPLRYPFGVPRVPQFQRENPLQEKAGSPRECLMGRYRPKPTLLTSPISHRPAFVRLLRRSNATRVLLRNQSLIGAKDWPSKGAHVPRPQTPRETLRVTVVALVSSRIVILLPSAVMRPQEAGTTRGLALVGRAFQLLASVGTGPAVFGKIRRSANSRKR